MINEFYYVKINFRISPIFWAFSELDNLYSHHFFKQYKYNHSINKSLFYIHHIPSLYHYLLGDNAIVRVKIMW